MCPFCNAEKSGSLIGRRFCERHERVVSDRAVNYNLSRDESMDQLCNIYQFLYLEKSKEKK
jgi:hypothetical protein